MATTKRAMQEKLQSARLEVYRPAILEAAEQLFAEEGFERARIKDIAKRAGVSVGSVYGVFDGKAAIFKAVHEARAEVLLSGADDIIRDTEPEDALDVILAGVDYTIRFFCAHPTYLRMQLREGTTWAESAARVEQADTWRRGVHVISVSFEAGMTAGVLYPGDPLRSARMVMAMLQVALAGWLESQDEAEIDGLVDEVQQLVARAFAAPDAFAGPDAPDAPDAPTDAKKKEPM